MAGEQSAMRVGDRVLLLPSSNDRLRDPREVTISKVGRKYVYAEVHGRPVAFEADTGWEKTEYPGSAHRVVTPEQHAEDGRREAANRRLAPLVRFDGWSRHLTVEQIHTLAEWLEQGDG